MDIREQINTPEGRLHIFSRFLRLLNYSSDFEETLALLAGESKTLMQSEAMVLFLIDSNTESIYYHMSFGVLGECFKNIVIDERTIFYTRAIKSVAPLYSNDPENEPFFFPVVDTIKGKAKNALFVPLRSHKKNVGSLIYINKINSEYNDIDLDLAVLIADFLAISLSNNSLYKETQIKAYEAYALYQLSMAINESDSLNEVLNENMSVICEAFEAHRVSIIIKEGDDFVFKCSVGISDDVVNLGKVNVEDNILSEVLRTDKALYSRNIDVDSLSNFGRPLRYKSKSFIVAPIHDHDDIIGFICVTERTNDIAFKLSDLNLLEMLSQQISENYKNVMLSKEAAIKQKMDLELAVTAQIQQSILPKNFKNNDGIDIYAKNIPAKEVGGDFYDFIDIGNGKYVSIIADVSGKGLPAGLFMTMTRSIIKVHFGITDNPAKSLSMTNKYVYEDSKTGMFVTCFAAVIDTNIKKITFANAGHGEQYLLSRVDDEYNIKIMTEPSKPLGFIDKVEYKNHSIKYNSGDFLMLFTDGVTDTFNDEGNDYGEDRLKTFLTKSTFESSIDLYEKVLEDTIQYKGNGEQFDDITMMILRLP